MNLSAVVLTHNSSRTLDRCLSSLKGLADEIIIIDDYSTDTTSQIASTFSARLFTRRLDQDFAAQRNFGLNQASGKWVLFLDSDEIVPPALAAAITAATKSSSISGYYLRRRDFFMGRWLSFGETSHVKFIRLAQRSSGRWTRPVHEEWQITGKVGELPIPLDHYPPASLSEFWNKVNRYSTIAAAYRRPSRWRNLFELAFFPGGKFIYNYFVRLGCLDGFPGLIMASMMSLHSLLIRLKRLR